MEQLGTGSGGISLSHALYAQQQQHSTTLSSSTASDYTVRQLAMRCVHASTQIHTKNIFTWYCQDNGQSNDHEQHSQIIQITNRPMCPRRLQKHVGQTAPSIGLNQNTIHNRLGKRIYPTNQQQFYPTPWSEPNRQTTHGTNAYRQDICGTYVWHLLPAQKIGIPDH